MPPLQPCCFYPLTVCSCLGWVKKGKVCQSTPLSEFRFQQEWYHEVVRTFSSPLVLFADLIAKVVGDPCAARCTKLYQREAVLIFNEACRDPRWVSNGLHSPQFC